MKLSNNEDPKTHLAELKEHFQLMAQRHNNPNPIDRHSRPLRQPSELVLRQGLQVAAK